MNRVRVASLLTALATVFWVMTTHAAPAGAADGCEPAGRAQVCGGILERYRLLGTAGGALGEALSPGVPTPDGVGRVQPFQHGLLYWHRDIGAWEVYGAIGQRYAEIGWERGPLGYPVSGEHSLPDGIGRVNRFQGGSLFFSPSTGAWEVYGAIAERYRILGSETSPLGYPMAQELPTADGVGRFQHFQGGLLYWHPSTGAYEVYGAILSAYADQRWERGSLGYPESGELPSGDGGRVQEFQHGRLYWHPGAGTSTILHTQPQQGECPNGYAPSSVTPTVRGGYMGTEPGVQCLPYAEQVGLRERLLQRHRTAIVDSAREHGLDPLLVAATIHHEGGAYLDPLRRDGAEIRDIGIGAARDGSIGIAQIQVGTAHAVHQALYGTSYSDQELVWRLISDDEFSIRTAAGYLRLLRDGSCGTPDSRALFLAYAPSPDVVCRLKARGWDASALTEADATADTRQILMAREGHWTSSVEQARRSGF